MGRKRKIRKELPERVYYKHSAYYFVTPEGKWVRLDSDFRKAMTRWAEIIEKPTNIRSMGDVGPVHDGSGTIESTKDI